MTVDIWIWDDGLRKEFEKQIEKAGGADRLLYWTADKSANLTAEEDMMSHARYTDELKEQAANGKNKGNGKNGGGNDMNKGNGKNGGGKFPAWNGGKGGERRW